MTFILKPLTLSLLRLLWPAPCQSLYNIASAFRASQPAEERAPHYDPKHFYPIQIPTILAERYQELRITERITQANSHEGRYCVRTLLDAFDLPEPYGNHVCMVFDPLYEPLWMLKRRFQGIVLPPNVLRAIARMVIIGLDYLHTQSDVIDTDIKPDNILVALRDHPILNRVIQDEIEDPLPQRILEDRTIYLSRSHFGFQASNIGRLVITDFGLSVRGDEGPHHIIQPNGFRAPKVVIGASKSYSAVVGCYHHPVCFPCVCILLRGEECGIYKLLDRSSANRYDSVWQQKSAVFQS
ncbi:unnamed protein product [Penicillium salamii]|uniref:non-specific serine/threonine protein kinase n=1 Tax=Penicillium salamii TaxID=1612424 RepID=A0A9W4NNA0_9EURO|nr:unnamed protein product [Penicillium salamii]CAG8139053.1 unnamed protein product [Penicillium salamii]CAG8156189.1 unnamed protein product [Penicillium salamii]CAG8158242.1 unnamed protein product [Penicillium salamii]CAG8257840.1 unnamed protein product [Penicillium salamii]